MKFTMTFVFADRPGEYNTSNFRMIMPGKAIGKLGYGVSAVPVQLFQENTKDAQEALEKSHVIIVERNFVGDVITQLAYWKVRGRTIILNWDDAYHAIEETNISYPYWHDGKVNVVKDGKQETLNVFPHPYDQFQWGIDIGHAATLPSPYLVNYWNDKIPSYLVPNYFNTEYYINIPKEKRPYITIGWGGSVSHLQSFRDSGVLEALKNVCQARDNIRVMICGDKRVYDKIELPEEKKIFQNYVPYEQWGGIIAKSFDIGIAPLSGEYDKYRSWIKPIEFMLTKTPWLCSDNGITYYEIKNKNFGKFIKNNPDDWAKALLETVDNLENENELISQKPYEFALKQDIGLHAEEIVNIYREIALKHGKLNLYQSPNNQNAP